MEKLIENLFNETTLSSYEAASNALLDYYATANDSEKVVIKEAILKKGEMVSAKSAETLKRADALIAKFSQKEVIIEVDGVKYPLKEWLTIKEYCDTFGLKTTSIVTNWSKRGIIPAENILFLPQLNIRLIKAVSYK
jgi:hypothetical protein